jgi:hypothetical protein
MSGQQHTRVPEHRRVYYHGGKAGLAAGDVLVPSPPHVTDGCPICVAREAGRGVTVGEYRRWLQTMGPRALPILEQLSEAPDDEVLDPPSARNAVYLTTSRDYALFYAARSGHGDLYEVEPVGDVEHSPEDHFTSYTASAARVKRVVQRRVFLRRNDRRRILRAWRKADTAAERALIAGEQG